MIENIIKQFFDEGFTYEKIDGICEISTPFLDGHNDHIVIYLSEGENGLYKVSDGGYIRFETNSKNIPMFIGTSRFTNDDEVYTLTQKEKIPTALIDMVTLIILMTHQPIINKMLTEVLRERRN